MPAHACRAAYETCVSIRIRSTVRTTPKTASSSTPIRHKNQLRIAQSVRDPWRRPSNSPTRSTVLLRMRWCGGKRETLRDRPLRSSSRHSSLLILRQWSPSRKSWNITHPKWKKTRLLLRSFVFKTERSYSSWHVFQLPNYEQKKFNPLIRYKTSYSIKTSTMMGMSAPWWTIWRSIYLTTSSNMMSSHVMSPIKSDSNFWGANSMIRLILDWEGVWSIRLLLWSIWWKPLRRTSRVMREKRRKNRWWSGWCGNRRVGKMLVIRSRSNTMRLSLLLISSKNQLKLYAFRFPMMRQSKKRPTRKVWDRPMMSTWSAEWRWGKGSNLWGIQEGTWWRIGRKC